MSNALKVPQADTLDRLIGAADEELRAVGIEALTIRSVATRAGTSTATAYNYLHSRHHLFAELFLREVLLAHPVEIKGRTPLARVRSVTRHLAGVLAGEPHLAAAGNHALLGSDPDAERLRVVIGNELIGRFRAALAPAEDDELLDALSLVLTGSLLQAGMGFIAYDDLADRLDVVVATVLRGNA